MMITVVLIVICLLNLYITVNDIMQYTNYWINIVHAVIFNELYLRIDILHLRFTCDKRGFICHGQ